MTDDDHPTRPELRVIKGTRHPKFDKSDFRELRCPKCAGMEYIVARQRAHAWGDGLDDDQKVQEGTPVRYCLLCAVLKREFHEMY